MADYMKTFHAHYHYTWCPLKTFPNFVNLAKIYFQKYQILIYSKMLSNYFCAQISNFKRLSLLSHTLRQGYDVLPVYKFCTKLRHLFRREVTRVY